MELFYKKILLSFISLFMEFVLWFKRQRTWAQFIFWFYFVSFFSTILVHSWHYFTYLPVCLSIYCSCLSLSLGSTKAHTLLFHFMDIWLDIEKSSWHKEVPTHLLYRIHISVKSACPHIYFKKEINPFIGILSNTFALFTKESVAIKTILNKIN